jgi:hypothetical protein
LGQARSWDRPFKILGTSPLLGQALQNSWDKPALGTASDKEAIQSTRRRHLPSTRSSFVKKPPAIHKKPAASAIHKKPSATHKKPPAIHKKKPSAIENDALRYLERKKKAKLEKDAKKRKNVTVRARLAAKKGVAYTPRAAEFLKVAVQARAAQVLAKVIYILMEGPINFSIFLFGVSFGLYWFVLVCFGPKGPHGRGAQGTPWEGNPWEPKGPHGRGPLGPPVGAIKWERPLNGNAQ